MNEWWSSAELRWSDLWIPLVFLHLVTKFQPYFLSGCGRNISLVFAGEMGITACSWCRISQFRVIVAMFLCSAYDRYNLDEWNKATVYKLSLLFPCPRTPDILSLSSQFRIFWVGWDIISINIHYQPKTETILAKKVQIRPTRIYPWN